MGGIIGGIDIAARELLLFAGAGLLIGGVDDLLVDFLYLARRARTGRRGQTHLDHLPPAITPGRMIVFIPAWDEAEVIGAMLSTALGRFVHDDYRLYVGLYPNDPATIAAAADVAAKDERVRLVIGDRAGPTTKADCLNKLWHALARDRAVEGFSVKAIVLHDSEDVVHPAELTVFDSLIEGRAVVQLPVLPLVVPGSRLVSGHYADEFAESHRKQLIVRTWIGAGMPLAGTGCAIAPDMLAEIAERRGSDPFDATSLTEDYELCRDQDKPSYAEQEIISSRTRKHRRNLQKAALKGWIRVRDLGGCNSQRGACRQVHPRCFQSTATSFLEEPSWRRLRL
ncbi:MULTISPECIES: glycosyltransferase [Sphingomonas]|uniref:glycosyltransferase n=1 Tax=Sphingomonas TaxID=13687 RepID=UPI00254A96A2|nr:MULTISPECIES: glycosyltransferase [Sphingomonas]MDK8187288.1 glycosyltransferase [Sphingomonas zeae]MDK8217030.1 glycosyltransferase [Sphingomonas sp. UMB7805-LC452B]